MNRDDVIRIAKEVYGDDEGKPFHESALYHLELFANLVIQHKALDQLTAAGQYEQGFEDGEPSMHREPNRPWQGLTDDEIEELWGEPVDCMFSGTYKGIRAIEAKLKEKNT